MKQLRREIDRRLDYVNYVTHEPQVKCSNGFPPLPMVSKAKDHILYFQLGKPGSQDVPHHHRLQLLDKIGELDVVIAR